MAESPTWLFKRCAEFQEKENFSLIPKQTRGLYALLKYRRQLKKYDVVYVGMTAGIMGRLKKHRRDLGNEWSHFSVFEVHDNIGEGQIREIEGLLRHIYRRDSRANKLNVQKQHIPLKQVRSPLHKWES